MYKIKFLKYNKSVMIKINIKDKKYKFLKYLNTHVLFFYIVYNIQK